MNKRTEGRWGIISSFVIHILFFLFFLIVHVTSYQQPEEFVELTFANAFAIPSERYSPPPPPPKTSPPPATRQNKQNNQAREVVKLPQRRMLEQEKSEIEPPPKERIYMEQDPSRIGTRQEVSREPQREEIKPDPRERYIGKREDVPSPLATTSTRPSPSQQSSQYGEGLAPAQAFSIEWTGGIRGKIRGDLPQYPSGLNKSATIRIRFFVLPDGSVGQMIPLQKGDATFEGVSLKALKNWQFNRLESNAPQIPQQGTVTFIFRVE